MREHSRAALMARGCVHTCLRNMINAAFDCPGHEANRDSKDWYKNGGHNRIWYTCMRNVINAAFDCPGHEANRDSKDWYKNGGHNHIW